MKKTLLSTALLLANIVTVLPAVANNSTTPVHINSTVLAQIQWQDVPLSQTVKTTLTEQQKQAFTAQFAGVASPVAAYRIPANQGTLEIEIESPVVDKNLFVPTAVVLDGNFNVAATYPSSEFKLQEERGLKGNRLGARLNLTPSINQDYIYLLVYTTQQDLAKTTIVPHPAKLYAKATGKQPPAINDIEVAHSLNGKIEINVSGANGTKFIGLPTEIFSSDKASTPVGKPAASTVQNPGAVITAVDKDTEAYFNQAVTKALKAKDVNKALNLVNEAEKLGLKSPRQIFLKNVNSN
ncbi:maltose operon protein MalM [Actinobacillus succinogenes]|uniref:Maltose operon periplasmic n=1 Tax=Actinobacillus succinogenes (strain ATCC 55618 / DSM 22257 / CCUG 43843 / 130Z) TaxID=339671 RepID=A6VL54_ACTSZ|nr:maltose operon protein MalM [Actinobacillus succinogenes]ABR73701.1 Maltose operon periplasmic [Actinobacillus succinogenes 130Z]PHI39841.1 maltose operon protein MalM [Actinobacillus succinogenes]